MSAHLLLRNTEICSPGAKHHPKAETIPKAPTVTIMATVMRISAAISAARSMMPPELTGVVVGVCPPNRSVRN